MGNPSIPVVRTGLMLVAALAGLAGPMVAADEQKPFTGAKWIWYSREPMPASIDFPAGAAWFRGAFELPAGAQVTAAELTITADNLWLIHLNGKAVGCGEMNPNAWQQTRRFDITGMLQPGRNVVCVQAVNTAAGPAGLIASVKARLTDGPELAWHSSDSWKCSDREQANCVDPAFDDTRWQAAHVVGDHGMAPWGNLTNPAKLLPSGPFESKAQRKFQQLKTIAIRGGAGGVALPLLRDPEPGETWPDALVFIGGDCSLYRPATHSGTSADSLSVTIFNPNHGRAYPEHDLPSPVKIGRQLMTLRPARPGTKPQVLWDAGQGAIGPPAVSYDGRWIYFPMAAAGESFFHIYQIPAEGGTPVRLTDGPFHDIDPCELPDGRLVFSSTRAGTFEEYHNPPSRALFTRETDGRIQPFTHTFQFDNEPKMMADGRVLMLRTDNFFDRGKVETILHAVFPDGSGGLTEFGLDHGPEYGNRLRAFTAGSAAPMPDGRVAWVDGSAIRMARPGQPASQWRNLEVTAADVAAMPDNRLICTVATGAATAPGGWPFRALAMLDPDATEPAVVVLHESTGPALHSPAYLGPRPKPPQLAKIATPDSTGRPGQTGTLYCQDVRNTRYHTAGWDHVRAIRVLAGHGLTLRSSHSYLVHAGSEVVELGTVPLAPDGSFAIEVPADTAIALQAVDAEGRSELNQMSWMYVRPGETRGCIGCHQPRDAAPPLHQAMPLAMTAPPLKLTGRGDPPRFRGNNAAVTGLMELQFDRFRELAGANSTAKTDGGVDGLLEQLGRSTPIDAAQQHSTTQHLALARNAGAADALAINLNSPDREVRVATAVALATCGNVESLGPLSRSLVDPDPLVAQAAAVAIENLSGAPIAGFNAFSPVRERRAAAEGWLHGSPLPGGEDWLKQRLAELKGDNRDVARRAAVALAHCGGPSAANALRETFLTIRNDNPFPAWRSDHRHRGDGTRFNSQDAVNPRALQEITRALGAIGGDDVVPLLMETAAAHLNPETGNLFLAEAAVEGLDRVGSPGAESALLGLLGKLPPYFTHCRWYGDHDALIACHAAPVHARIVKALDRIGSRGTAPHTAALVRMVPTDPDRALLPGSDDFEAMMGRVIRRSGRDNALINACLRALGDPEATDPDPDLSAALDDVHAAWAGRPCREIRAAQILSLIVRDRTHVPRVIAAFERYRSKENSIPRVYDKGIPVVTKLPVRHWVCFYLARTLGQLGDAAAVPVLTDSLADSMAEAAAGRPDPLGPGVHFLHDDPTPCWRAAAAWALGRIGDPAASRALQAVLANPANAPDTRNAAASALGRLATATDVPALKDMAGRALEVSVRRALLEACERLQEP